MERVEEEMTMMENEKNMERNETESENEGAEVLVLVALNNCNETPENAGVVGPSFQSVRCNLLCETNR